MPYIIFASIILVFAYLIFFWIKLHRLRKRDEPLDVSEQAEPTQEVLEATVVDLACGARLVGMKTPKSVKEFMVVFQEENGNIRKFYVPEEMYHGFEVGQKGVLTLVDGHIYGFALCED